MVKSGVLSVVQFPRDSSEVEKTTLTANCVPLCVLPNVIHQFVAREDVQLLEIYSAVSGPIDMSDIHRFSEGGIGHD